MPPKKNNKSNDDKKKISRTQKTQKIYESKDNDKKKKKKIDEIIDTDSESDDSELSESSFQYDIKGGEDNPDEILDVNDGDDDEDGDGDDDEDGEEDDDNFDNDSLIKDNDKDDNIDDDCIYNNQKKNDLLNDDDDDISEDFFDDDDLEPQNKYISEDKRITTKKLTKYERINIIGTRAKQISLGAQKMVDTDLTDPKLIAKLELEMKRCPIILKRTLPSGEIELIDVNTLKITN